MALVPQDPFRHLENIGRDLNRLWNGDLNPFRHFGTPSIDVHETDDEVIAACDIPGLKSKEDLEIHVDDNILTIGGTVNRFHEVEEDKFHRQERFVGRFQRSVALPAIVSPEGVKAAYKNGVLEVHMPKVKTEAKKRIDVDFQ